VTAYPVPLGSNMVVTEDGSDSRPRPGVGWLWLGWAPGARSLEPVKRRTGSAALCAEPL
jgi:hypothetical protein